MGLRRKIKMGSPIVFDFSAVPNILDNRKVGKG